MPDNNNWHYWQYLMNPTNLKSHPHYKRWHNMVQRCSSPKCRDYKSFGGRGIRVSPEWGEENPDGVKNFLTWLEYELQKFYRQNPGFSNQKFEIGRKDVNQDYSPENCTVRPRGHTNALRRTAVLSQENVLAMRQHLRNYPYTSWHQFAREYRQSQAVIHRAVTGKTWKQCDVLVAPVTLEERNRLRDLSREASLVRMHEALDAIQNLKIFGHISRL